MTTSRSDLPNAAAIPKAKQNATSIFATNIEIALNMFDVEYYNYMSLLYRASMWPTGLQMCTLVDIMKSFQRPFDFGLRARDQFCKTKAWIISQHVKSHVSNIILKHNCPKTLKQN